MSKIWSLLFVVILAGCASVDGPDYEVLDIHEDGNRASYSLTDWVDRKTVLPAARGYRAAAPGWVSLSAGGS